MASLVFGDLTVALPSTLPSQNLDFSGCQVFPQQPQTPGVDWPWVGLSLWGKGGRLSLFRTHESEAGSGCLGIFRENPGHETALDTVRCVF